MIPQNYKYFNMDEAIDNALDLFYNGETAIGRHWWSARIF